MASNKALEPTVSNYVALLAPMPLGSQICNDVPPKESLLIDVPNVREQRGLNPPFGEVIYSRNQVLQAALGA